MKKLIDKIFDSCRFYFDDIVEIRRDIHMYPETEFNVHRTADIVAKQLETLEFRVKTGIGKTGVVGDLEICLLYTSDAADE